MLPTFQHHNLLLDKTSDVTNTFVHLSKIDNRFTLVSNLHAKSQIGDITSIYMFVVTVLDKKMKVMLLVWLSIQIGHTLSLSYTSDTP